MHLAHPGLVYVMRTLRNQAFDRAGSSQARTGRIPEFRRRVYRAAHIDDSPVWGIFCEARRAIVETRNELLHAHHASRYSTLLEILDILLDGMHCILDECSCCNTQSLDFLIIS
jgi:hypothetical protein